MKDKISIVVPIYNVELYLNKCIESLINQSYKNIEIVLVDDGSPDKCPEICDTWKKKDERIKVIHKKNGGLSDARNFGISNSTGKYICFVDSDDYVNKDYIKKLYTAIIQNNVNISQCGINYVNDSNQLLEQKGYDIDCLLNGENVIMDYYGSHYIENVVVWNKMYKKSLFKSIIFPVGKIHEDEFTTYKLIYNEEKIAITKDCLYNYRQTNNSIMRSTFNMKKLDKLDALKERLKYYANVNANTILIEKATLHYIYSIREIYYTLKKYFPDQKDRMLELKNEYEKIIKDNQNNININNFKNRLFVKSPIIFGFFRKIKNR
jgi:glycosyltransferase involved in cell wall biosynthesis